MIEASELMQKLSLAEQAPETSVLMTDEEKDLARDTGFFPDEKWKILPDDDSEVKLLSEESQRSE